MKINRQLIISFGTFLVVLAGFFVYMQMRGEGSILPGIQTKPNPQLTQNPRTTVTPLRSENIIVTAPIQNSEITSPVIVQGEARTFENSVTVRVITADGNVLTENFTTANAPDIGQFGPFEISLIFTPPTEGSGFIEVFQYSAKDGTEIDKVRVPVTFAKPGNEMPIQIFFNKQNTAECENVVAVTRSIPRTQQTARAAIDQLLMGTSQSEQQAGYLTSINSGVRVQRLVIQNGVAEIDFNNTLENGVAGSCKVQAIRSQIEQTLLQFDTVQSVKISINGRTEGSLQP